jgi:hypothetical protein
MFDSWRVAVVSVCVACSPGATSSPGAATPAAPAAGEPAAAPAGETCLLGDYRVTVQQRMVQDDGESALLEDQRIGAVPVLFAAQRKALRDRRVQDESGLPQPRVPNAPQTLLLAVGAQVTEELEDLEYVDNNGAKPTETRTTRQKYTFFLAEAAWDCAAAAAEIAAEKLPQGVVGAAACVPAALRARCVAVDFAAG